jgi:hypothetical protein
MRAAHLFHVLVLLALSGCGASVEGLAGGAVEGGLEELAQQERQRQLASVIADPEIQRATGEMVATLVGAAVGELTREERTAAIEDALARYSAVVGTELGSSVAQAVAREMRAALDEPLVAPDQLEQLSASVATGLARGLAVGLREEVGPATREVIREDVAVAMEEALDERLQAALGRAARTMAREAVIGATEAMAEGQEHRRGGGFRENLRGLFEQGEDVAQWSVAAVILLVVFALLSIGALLIAARRARRDARRTRSALTTMVGAIERAEDRAWSPELHAILREAYRGEDSAELVRSILREDPSLGSRVREAKERVDAKRTEAPAE